MAETTVNGHPPWHEKMLQPFDGPEIGIRPQLWCTACAKAPGKACGQTMYDVEHKRRKCPVCSQNISPGHLHLYYIGHAQLTRRLIETDPSWRWEPMHRDVTQPEVLIAAIASGDKDIVRMVLDSFPPKMTELEVSDGKGGTKVELGMWIRLILHDDDGNEISMPGFGDAKGKLWGGDALKEIIGDALRNAGMRRGAALGLWESQDLERAEKERREYNPDANVKDRMAMFDDDAPPPLAPPDLQGQEWADLAWQIVGSESQPGVALDEIRDQVHTPAMKKRRLGVQVHPPWSKDPAERCTLGAALTHIKNVLTTRQEAQAAQAAPEDTSAPAGG
jgi:hypothetical protein